MSVFASEIARCVTGRATLSQQLDAIEHYTCLGGFHPNVLEREQVAFKEWLLSVQPLPDQNAKPVAVTQPVEQMDLLSGISANPQQ